MRRRLLIRRTLSVGAVMLYCLMFAAALFVSGYVLATIITHA